MTKSQEIAADVSALLRARNPLLWIVTREEARVEGYIAEAAGAAGYATMTWDIAQGVINADGTVDVEISPEDTKDPGAAMSLIAERASTLNGRRVWIMRDLPIWLGGAPGASTLRQLRNLARSLPSVQRDGAQAVVVLSPSGEVPPELAGHTTVIEWPLPDRDEVAAILDATIATLPPSMKENAPVNGTRDAAIDAAVGLTGEEASACYAKSLVQTRTIDPRTVAQEKKRVIARERVLEWFDPIPGGLDAVGGLDNLKAWLLTRSTAYSVAARDYGLPPPKGALLAGIPGCGKSLTAKCIATAWGVPLLRLDLGSLKSKFVGESEGNLRKALRVIEAIGRCVVWLDEIEKALQGATSGSADGGVSSDALGAILSWMQERSGEAFIIATANDAESLPPELLRKGRFDEVWFIDLPTPVERAAVLGAALQSHKRNTTGIDLVAVAAATEGFTGSEVAELVPSALYAAFADSARAITTKDLIEAASTVVPLSKTADKKIKAIRDWASTRARPASRNVVSSAPAANAGRALDLA